MLLATDFRPKITRGRKERASAQHNTFEEGRATDGRSWRNWIEKEEWVQIEIGRKEAEFGGNRSHWCLRNIDNIPSCYNINPRYLLPYLGFYWYTLSITYQALIWIMYDLSLDFNLCYLAFSCASLIQSTTQTFIVESNLLYPLLHGSTANSTNSDRR